MMLLLLLHHRHHYQERSAQQKKRMIIDCFIVKRNRPHSELCNQSERKKPSVGECQDLATSDGSNDHDPDAQLLVDSAF